MAKKNSKNKNNTIIMVSSLCVIIIVVAVILIVGATSPKSVSRTLKKQTEAKIAIIWFYSN